MKTKNKKKNKLEEGYPKNLTRQDDFSSPIWFADEPKFVYHLNKATDKYIEEARKNMQPNIDKRNKANKTKGDLTNVYHSTSLIGEPGFLELQNYIGATSHNLLVEMGFDMSWSSIIYYRNVGAGIC